MGFSVAAEESFATSEGVVVSGSRTIDRGAIYEAGVRDLYGQGLEKQRFTTIINGARVNGEADTVAMIDGNETAIEAKYVDDWSASIRNPESAIGQKPWAIAEQQKMVTQASTYSSAFEGGAVYHTNRTELALFYSNVFKNESITNYRFIITPAGK